MQISHIALYVHDLEGMKEFYMRHFAAKANSQYHNPRTGLRTYFLSFEDGARLELMHWPDVAPSNPEPRRAGYGHLAFRVGSREKVDALSAQLSAAGCPVLSGPRVTGDGYYEVSLTDPEGNSLELVA